MRSLVSFAPKASLLKAYFSSTRPPRRTMFLSRMVCLTASSSELQPTIYLLLSWLSSG